MVRRLPAVGNGMWYEQGMNGIKDLLFPLLGLAVVLGLIAGFKFGLFTNERPDDGRQSASQTAPSAATTGQPTAQTDAPTPAKATQPEVGTKTRDHSGPQEILAMLNQLKVAKRERGADYDRNFFGKGWVDIDNNTCFTRADILARDLEGVKKKGRCKVQSGTLHDPYTGKTIAYRSGKDTSELVQIDHVVALLDAWGTGAQVWDEGKRVAFANDPLNLLAVDGQINDDKGHKNASQWLPPNQAFHCHYVARQVAVKARYGLWVTAEEKAAMAKVLEMCPAGVRIQGDTIIGTDL